jgi:hypothetical protein
MSSTASLCLLLQSCVPAEAGGWLTCPGLSVTGAMEAAAKELCRDVNGNARSGTPDDAGGVDVAVAVNRAETLNCGCDVRVLPSD